ncbi:uncharacterized protein LOC131841610 [Achroia grisella]|uniref:uncharacterized protein LOC131841610 n=1 Tax=Achroia grisella TaxID=688607 RepID=UPI0027D20B1D|nr:uncharacterized protein LOC131841610 [Achroia grisella]
MLKLSCLPLCVCLFLCLQSVLCQFGFFHKQDDDQRRKPFHLPNVLDPNRIRNRLTGLLHLSPEDKDSNKMFVFPFRRPGITNDDNQSNYYPNQYGNHRPVMFPNAPPNFGDQYNYGQNFNMYPPNIGPQYPPNNQNQPDYPQEVPYDPVNFNDNKPTVSENNNPSGVFGKPESPQSIPNIPPNANIPQGIPNVPPSSDASLGIPIKPPSTEAIQGIPTKPPNVETTPKIPNNPPTKDVSEVKPNGPNYGGPQEVLTVPPTPKTELPMLTPVPKSEERNNFNFGSHGIFQETCQTIDDEVGGCVNLFQCDVYLKVVQEAGSSPAAVQLLRRVHCGFEGNNPKVCCPRPGIPTAPPLPPSSPPPQPITEAPTITEEPDKPSEGKSASDDFVSSLPQPPDCGISNASFSRVIGGVDAHLGDFPWMALLGYKPKRGPGARWLCGGTLISSKHVLTAAHCIHLHEDDLFLVRLGELDLAREDDGATPTDVLIKKAIKHEEYSPKAYTNDIGILVLEKDVKFTALIRPICLPATDELRARNFENYNPIITGWGATEFRGPSATHLQALQLPVVSTEFCAQAYSQYKAQKIDDRVLCAGFKNGGKDACQGDSGGPLMQPIWDPTDYTTYFYQIGVVSYGKKCAEAGFPGVYSRVTHFIPWLTEKLVGTS